MVADVDGPGLCLQGCFSGGSGAGLGPMAIPTITAYDWVPDFAQGKVRDLRVRWALEEVGQPYRVRYLTQGSQKAPPHRAIQPFGQVPTYEVGYLTLFESGAIVLHIAETCGRILLPTEA